MKRIYLMVSKSTGDILAAQHGRMIDCQHMPEAMYWDSESVIRDVSIEEAKKLLSTKWKFKKAKES